MDLYLRADKDSGLMVIHSKITYAGEDHILLTCFNAVGSVTEIQENSLKVKKPLLIL